MSYKWQLIWNKRTLPNGENILDKLIQADGYDSGAGKIDVKSFKEYVEFIAKKIDIKEEESIFDIGCGGGVFLYLFYQNKHNVGGIDYSESLIKIAKDVMINMDFHVSEAIELDIKEKFNIVVSSGVFHYFPNLKYAEVVIRNWIKPKES